jgi:Flp pilus assembly protein TadB
VLAVYEHLAQTQAEIEQVKGRMAYLEKLSAMATISIELVPEEAEVQVIEQSWRPGHTLRNAARALVSTLEALANLGIWVVVFLLPVVLLVGVPLLVLVWLVRRRRRRRGQAETPPE